MIYKLTSINTVISKIVRDLGLGTEEIPWQDFIEWSAEGLNHIGSFAQYEAKTIPIAIINHKGVLPCDFYKIIGVTKSKCFNEPLSIKTREEINFFLDNLFEIRHNIPLWYWPQLTAGTLELSKINENSYQGRITEQPIVTHHDQSNRVSINSNGITAGFKCGFLQLEYLAFPVDCDGFPLVPDDVVFFDALFWKVVYQLSIRGYLFTNPQLNDIGFTRSMWTRYCGQARADSNMPDPLQAEQWKNNFLKLLPNFYPERSNYNAIYNNQKLGLDGRN